MENSTTKRLETLLDELVRLTALQIKTGMETQNQAIIALGEAGFGPARIAELLGTSANTANVALSKARKAGKGLAPRSNR